MNCYRSWPYVSGLNSGRAPRCWQSSSKRNVFQRQKEACPDVRLGCGLSLLAVMWTYVAGATRRGRRPCGFTGWRI